MKKILLSLGLVSLLLFSGCMPGSMRYSNDRKAGFLSGVWHGWIAPVSLVVKIFNNDVNVYETNNTGWWYQFGFYIAIIGGFGGISLSRKKIIKKKD